MEKLDIIQNILQKSESLKAEFPIDAFPERLQNIIDHYVEIKGYPYSYLGVGVLTALGVSIGNTHVLHTVNGYEAKGNLYAVMIGRRGFNKSEALSDAFTPIERFSDKIYHEYQKKIDAYDALSNKDREGQKEPYYAKPVLSDATTEATVQQMVHYPRGCGVIIDELAGLLKSFDQYRKSGGDEQFYLSAWSGKNITIDRATKRPIRINKVFLSIVGTTQPGVADEVFYGKEESGFLDRWLICYPDKVIKPYPGNNGIDPQVYATYEGILNELLSYEFENDTDQPISLRYTTEAWDIIYKYLCASIDIENNPETTETEGGIRAKMDIYVHRFCLILQLANFICGETSVKHMIEPQAARNAVKLANYFYLQAERKRIKERSELLPKQWKEVFDMLPDYGMPFTTAEFIERTNHVGIKQRTAKQWLKDNHDHKGDKILTKLKYGVYAKS